MTVADQIKTLDRKFKQNEAQYDLDRKAAKTSGLSSENLKMYEFSTGEDLWYEPSALEKAKFEYSQLGKVFNKGLDKDDQKEGLLKRLKNIEDKSEKQLKAFKGKTDTKSQIDLFNEELSLEAAALLKEIKDIGDNVDYDKLFYTGGNKKPYGFKNFKTLEKLIKDIHNKNMTIDEARIKQSEFDEELDKLKAYSARGSKLHWLKRRCF